MTKVLLAPLDPVHDNAIKILKRRLTEEGYEAISMPPGVTCEEVIDRALVERPAALLVSRTLGYKVAEIMSRLVDLAEASGLRETTRLGIGGMAITRELGAELGFDACFVGDLKMRELLAFLEGKTEYAQVGEAHPSAMTSKPDLTAGHTYAFHDPEIEQLLDRITDQILAWTDGKTTPAIERAKIREEILAGAAPDAAPDEKLQARYVELCDAEIQAFYRDGRLPDGVRWVEPSEIESLPGLLEGGNRDFNSVRHVGEKPIWFMQYGTGCPIMDVLHIKTGEAWGMDGFIHFDPSWGAQREGLLSGCLTHEHDGTIVTLENLQFIRHWMEPNSLWNVRGHRGLNTPETQVLGCASGADLFKINIPYGGTAGGTDPARLTVDGVYSLRLTAKYGIPFDIPGNDELSGVPPHKTFAGILVMMALGLKLGAKPIPKPLLCYSPYMAVSGLMDDNMIDMNVAKLAVWNDIVDTPVWPGEPIGFMTHTPDRVQSSVMTAAHAALASSMGVTAATFASSDEAYSKGPISVQARVDTIRATRDLLRFLGSANFQATPQAGVYRAQLHEQITGVLREVAECNDFVQALYTGLFGNVEDGLSPGRTGRGSVIVA
ncbi:MAG TPA: hypothetical protein VHO48_10075 [Anaerolineaceae bacterium]|nr:hypothetical protein [Anaerolineaceae bacterium]